MEASSHEFLNSIHFHAVAAQIQRLQLRVLEKTLADGKHDLFADAAARQTQMSQVLAAAQHGHDSFGELNTG